MKAQGKNLIQSLLLSLLLVACSSSTPQNTPIANTPTTIPLPPPTPTPLPPPISPEFPTGIFYHQHAENGSYSIFKFNSDGTFAYYWITSSLDVSNIPPNDTGTYRIDGNLHTIVTTTWFNCPPPVTYAWTYDGQTLTFQVVGNDPCLDRQQTYEDPLMYKRLK